MVTDGRNPVSSFRNLQQNSFRLPLPQGEVVVLHSDLDGVAQRSDLFHFYLLADQHSHVHQPPLQGPDRADMRDPPALSRFEHRQVHRPCLLTMIFIAMPRPTAIRESSTFTRRASPPRLLSISTSLPGRMPMSSSRTAEPSLPFPRQWPQQGPWPCSNAGFPFTTSALSPFAISPSGNISLPPCIPGNFE